MIDNGELICDSKYVNEDKMGDPYNWVVSKMNKKVKNETTAKYPLWCWVKCYNSISPPKHKGIRVDGFDVKITFNKDVRDVFVTDYRRYSFILNNKFIPSNKEEKEMFDKKLKDLNINLNDINKDNLKIKDIYSDIYSSFDRCITTDSDILQGCVWSIKLKEVEKIEILKDDGYVYGSLNYIRKNGKRMDWVKDFYKFLK